MGFLFSNKSLEPIGGRVVFGRTESALLDTDGPTGGAMKAKGDMVTGLHDRIESELTFLSNISPPSLLPDIVSALVFLMSCALASSWELLLVSPMDANNLTKSLAVGPFFSSELFLIESKLLLSDSVLLAMDVDVEVFPLLLDSALDSIDLDPWELQLRESEE